MPSLSSDQATFQSMIERLGLKPKPLHFHGEFNEAGQLTELYLKVTTVLEVISKIGFFVSGCFTNRIGQACILEHLYY